MICSGYQQKKISAVVEQLEDIDGQLPEVRLILELEKPVDIILADMKTAQDTEAEMEDLVLHLKLMADLELEISSFKDVLAVEGSLTLILGLYDQKTKLMTSEDDLSTLVTKLHAISNSIVTVKEDLKEKEVSYKENMPEICPL